MSSRQAIITPGTHHRTCDTGFFVPLFVVVVVFVEKTVENLELR